MLGDVLVPPTWMLIAFSCLLGVGLLTWMVFAFVVGIMSHRQHLRERQFRQGERYLDEDEG